jgi:hypothetical protein
MRSALNSCSPQCIITPRNSRTESVSPCSARPMIFIAMMFVAGSTRSVSPSNLHALAYASVMACVISCSNPCMETPELRFSRGPQSLPRPTKPVSYRIALQLAPGWRTGANCDQYPRGDRRLGEASTNFKDIQSGRRVVCPTSDSNQQCWQLFKLSCYRSTSFVASELRCSDRLVRQTVIDGDQGLSRCGL